MKTGRTGKAHPNGPDLVDSAAGAVIELDLAVSLRLFQFGRCIARHSSGKGTALPPLLPLKTGRESFPSSGSSRYKARVSGAGFTTFSPGFVAMDAEPSSGTHVPQSRLPLWVERDGVLPPAPSLNAISRSEERPTV
jgi:hypothetical protein